MSEDEKINPDWPPEGEILFLNIREAVANLSGEIDSEDLRWKMAKALQAAVRQTEQDCPGFVFDPAAATRP